LFIVDFAEQRLPMDFSWLTYEYVKEFQSLIGTMVGFLGVILTLIINAMLHRRQHRHETEHLRAAVASSLLAELKRNNETFEYNLKHMDGISEGSGIIAPINPITSLYDCQLERIGYLHGEQLTAVMSAYSQIKSVPERLQLTIALKHGRPDVSGGYILVPPAVLVPLRHMLEQAKEASSAAIAALEKS
jgi:hypothetical protein